MYEVSSRDLDILLYAKPHSLDRSGENEGCLNLAIGEADDSHGGSILVKDGTLVKTKPLLEIVNYPWKMFLNSDNKEQEIDLLRKHERTGRPLGEDAFIEKLELYLDRNLKPHNTWAKKER